MFLETLCPENVNPILPELFLRVPRGTDLGVSEPAPQLPWLLTCFHASASHAYLLLGTPVSVCDSHRHPLLWPLEEAMPFLFPFSAAVAKLCLPS